MSSSILDVDGYVRVTLLKEYSYCPRLAYYKLNLMAEPESESMSNGVRASRMGSAREAIRDALAGLPTGFEWVEFQVCLRSARLRLRGCVDAVARRVGGGLCVVDYKSVLPPRRFSEHLLVQAGGYALLVEEAYGERVECVALVSSESSRVYPFDARLRARVTRILERVHSLRLTGLPEPTRRKARCRACFYARFCGL